MHFTSSWLFLPRCVCACMTDVLSQKEWIYTVPICGAARSRRDPPRAHRGKHGAPHGGCDVTTRREGEEDRAAHCGVDGGKVAHVLASCHPSERPAQGAACSFVHPLLCAQSICIVRKISQRVRMKFLHFVSMCTAGTAFR